MKFFESSGDTPKVFKFGEEVFDTVAFPIEMLVNGRLDGSIGVHGYDGGATNLIHTLADGVAVVALVHQGE